MYIFPGRIVLGLSDIMFRGPPPKTPRILCRHQQNGQITVGTVGAVAITQQRSPQRHPPRPQRDHSTTGPAHSATGFSWDYFVVALWCFDGCDWPVFDLRINLLLAECRNNVDTGQKAPSCGAVQRARYTSILDPEVHGFTGVTLPAVSRSRARGPSIRSIEPEGVEFDMPNRQRQTRPYNHPAISSNPHNHFHPRFVSFPQFDVDFPVPFLPQRP